jgi:hypothetical protein
MNYIIYSNPRVGSWMTTEHISAYLPQHRVYDIISPGIQHQSGPQFDYDHPCIIKTHDVRLPRDPSQFHCVYLSRRDEWAQWCSSMLAVITLESREYTDSTVAPRIISGRVMLDIVQSWRQYEQWVLAQQSLDWCTFTHLVYEDILQTPKLLCTLIGDEPHMITPRSSRDYRDVILNWHSLRRLYRARFGKPSR